MLDPCNLDHYNDQPKRIPINSERLTNIWIGDLLRDMNTSIILRSHGQCCVLDALGEHGMWMKHCHSKPDDYKNYSKYPSVPTCDKCISAYLNRKCNEWEHTE